MGGGVEVVLLVVWPGLKGVGIIVVVSGGLLVGRGVSLLDIWLAWLESIGISVVVGGCKICGRVWITGR